VTRRWEKATEWPLTIAALAFLAAYAIPIKPDIPAGLEEGCRVTVWVLWALIGAEFIARVALAEHRPSLHPATFVRRLIITSVASGVLAG
jgi:hypothetical protein